MKRFCIVGILGILTFGAYGQKKEVELAVSKEEFILENHIEDVETLVHKLTGSEQFLKILLENGHHVDPRSTAVKRKDVSIGEDIDLYVSHLTEHQTFTLMLLPINFYKLGIYDTLLITALEVSDQWIMDSFRVQDPNDSLKAALLAQQSHQMLEKHILNRAIKIMNFQEMGETDVHLHESFISTKNVNEDVRKLTKDEKRSFRKSWSLIKKALTHDVNLNVEINIYAFGIDDMDVTFTSRKNVRKFVANPSNIFERHSFKGDSP